MSSVSLSEEKKTEEAVAVCRKHGYKGPDAEELFQQGCSILKKIGLFKNEGPIMTRSRESFPSFDETLLMKVIEESQPQHSQLELCGQEKQKKRKTEQSWRDDQYFDSQTQSIDMAEQEALLESFEKQNQSIDMAEKEALLKSFEKQNQSIDMAEQEALLKSFEKQNQSIDMVEQEALLESFEKQKKKKEKSSSQNESQNFPANNTFTFNSVSTSTVTQYPVQWFHHQLTVQGENGINSMRYSFHSTVNSGTPQHLNITQNHIHQVQFNF